MRAPDAYALAGSIAVRCGAVAIINIGSNPMLQPTRLPGVRAIGIDLREIEDCRPALLGATWRGMDLETAEPIAVSGDEIARSIIVCVNLIEGMLDPCALLEFLSTFAGHAHAILITTQDKDAAPVRLDEGSRAEFSECKWNIAEFEEFLHAWHLRPMFLGLTANSTLDHAKGTILAIVGRPSMEVIPAIPADFCPLAIVATYNDIDIAPAIVGKLLDDGIDVHALDNWSRDGTFEAMLAISADRNSLTVERFPPTGPTRYYEWRNILQRKEEVAATFPGRWIIHCDSDEVLSSPWTNVSLRAGLFHAKNHGSSAVDFTVCNFLPVDASFPAGADPETHFRYFEFGLHPAYSVEVRSWQQGTERVDLARNGGHQAEFPARKIFPYKFIMKHYSIRSPDQARRKVFTDRLGRFHPDERKMGWHSHYDDFSPADAFIWNASKLIQFDERSTRQRYLTELIAGIGITDLAQGLSDARCDAAGR